MPHNPILSEFLRDALAISASIMTLVGFAIAIYQIWRAKTAAREAERVAREVLAESRAQFEIYAFANLMLYAQEADQCVSRGAWESATMRLNDLAQQATQLGQADPDWKQLADDLLSWAAVFRRIDAGGLKDSIDKRRKWSEFSLKLRRKINVHHGPFQSPSGANRHDPSTQS